MKNNFLKCAMLRGVAVSAFICGVLLNPAQGVNLADSPVLSPVSVPGNLLLALSVEYPTASTYAYPSTPAYAPATKYLGLFDPEKCYRYVPDSTTPADSYFTPDSAANSHACTTTAAKALWSGNYLNWSSTQTLDAFRWALTGGPRVVDSMTDTVIAKTWHSGQQDPGTKTLSANIAGATPFSGWATVLTKINGLGYAMQVTKASGNSTLENYNSQSSAGGNASNTKVYVLYIRVKVCDSAAGLEANCKQYGSGSAAHYKPEGLLQQYSSKLRYAAFGYLNDDNVLRDGGVMRARMKFIGQTQPVPGSGSIANAAAEWDADGRMLKNPDAADATNTTAASGAAGYSVSVADSGVMNYLNKFGSITGSHYKTYDPVSELYYSGLRYFRNVGNVPEYSSLSGAGSLANMTKWIDGFPVISSWADPVQYSCQSNFILGIGDVNTHRDSNIYGSALSTAGQEPALPSSVASDTFIDAKTSTNLVGGLEGKGNLGNSYLNTGRYDTYFIAGLAFHAHTKDIRADLAGKQTVSTYWLDVMEGQTYVSKNEYYLATKYGGFAVPSGFDPDSPSSLSLASWHSGNSTDTVGSDLRPDNYFLANQADKMVDGLTKAFADIATKAGAATTTAFSAASPNQKINGSISYAASYDSSNWSGSLTASTVSYDSAGNPSYVQKWNARDSLNQRSPTSRIVVTCCKNGWTDTAGTSAGIPFAVANLSASTFSRLNYPSFANVATASSSSSAASSAASSKAAQYVAYLRGDRSLELSSSSSSASGQYRARTHLLGDIVSAKLDVVGPPRAPYFDVFNPGYSAFKSLYRSRKTVVFAASNDGMLHAFDGSVASSSSSSSVASAASSSTLSSSSSSAASSCASGGACGYELFAYIPSFMYGDVSSATTSGLASLGNGTGTYSHHFMVDATPQDFDIDFNKTNGAIASGTDWRTLLVGGLGKGGKGFYAIDVTNPSDWTSETQVASKVLWEFTDQHMGYSYGAPAVVKTKRWGWVVVLTSGYNNDDNQGHIYFVNPRTGQLLEDVATVSGTVAAPINLAHATAYVANERDWTADAIYAGDLLGNVWRVDVSGTSAYAAPVRIATLTAPATASSSSSSSSTTSSSSASVGQPITTRLLLAVEPGTLKRYIVAGTGRLLASTDLADTQAQSIYAIVDGTNAFGGFFSTATLPTGVSFPVTRTDLNNNSNLLAGIGSSPTKQMGWYHDLKDSASAASSASSSAASSSSSSSAASSSSSSSVGTERVDVEPDYQEGKVAFAINLPYGDVCSSLGSSHRELAFSVGTGKSLLINPSDGSAIATTDYTPGVVTDIRFISQGGRLRLISGSSSGTVSNLSGNFTTSGGVRRLNWRELPAVD